MTDDPFFTERFIRASAIVRPAEPPFNRHCRRPAGKASLPGRGDQRPVKRSSFLVSSLRWSTITPNLSKSVR